MKYTPATHWVHSLPFQQFQALFNSLFKVLFIFPSRYLFAIGLSPIFSFRWNLPPTLSCTPKQLDSSKARHMHRGSEERTGLSPSLMPCSKGLIPGPWSGDSFYRLQFGGPNRPPDFQVELFPLHSPLLGESWLVSFPPLSYMLKFSGSSYLIRGPKIRDLLRPGQQHHLKLMVIEILTWRNYHTMPSNSGRHCRLSNSSDVGGKAPQDAHSPPVKVSCGYRHSNKHAPRRGPGSAICVQNFDDSLSSAIRITYRISLRSSSLREPRYPPLKVVFAIMHCLP